MECQTKIPFPNVIAILAFLALCDIDPMTEFSAEKVVSGQDGQNGWGGAGGNGGQGGGYGKKNSCKTKLIIELYFLLSSLSNGQISFAVKKIKSTTETIVE